MPYSQHPYQYAYSNPVVYTDPSGECVGPISWLRELEPVNCSNADAAWHIANHPNASRLERQLAEGYLTAFWGSHAALAIGGSILGVKGGIAAGGATMTGGRAILPWIGQQAMQMRSVAPWLLRRAAIESGMVGLLNVLVNTFSNNYDPCHIWRDMSGFLWKARSPVVWVRSLAFLVGRQR